MSILGRPRDPAPDPLGSEVRAALGRRADGVRPSPDACRRLTARLAEEESIVVHLGRSPAASARRRLARLLALAALAAAVAAAVVWFSALDSITDAWGVLPARR
ncbi:MAG TPA: hypothetical protein VFZ68_05535 [Acidimicrobiales bacterium]